MPALAFTELKKIGSSDSVVSCEGTTHEGLDFYAYIKTTSDNVKKINQIPDTNEAIYNLREFGKVIYMGIGKKPDEKAKNYVQEWLKHNS